MKKLTDILQEIEIFPISVEQVAKLYFNTDTDKMLEDQEFMKFFDEHISGNSRGIYHLPKDQLVEFYKLLKKVNGLK